MPFVFKRLALFLSIAAAFAADKEPAPFRPGPAASFARHQTNDQVTIGVDPYNVGAEKIKAAFGKIDPYQLGVLPVLVVMQNDSGEALRLDQIKVEYLGPNHNRVTATPGKEVKYLRGPDRPNVIGGPTGPVPARVKKNPLNAWEIEGRAFSAQMLPAGNSAFGFFYFDTGLQRGATIYISGITQARTGKELLYFEIPLE